MINLGLQRMRELLRYLGNPEQKLNALHVAGTNGKGSVCTYLETTLTLAGKKTAKYTSPHLRYPSDSIQLDCQSLDLYEYSKLYREISDLSVNNQINATPFEIGTALAFTEMAEFKPDFSIVEVGLGGLEDATNVLLPENVACSAITKIAIDHEQFLGSTLESVSSHKAGIMKPGVTCVIDGSNDELVLDTIGKIAVERGSPLIVTPTNSSDSMVQQNQAVARSVLKYLGVDSSLLESGIARSKWEGRLEFINDHTLVDGCHNVSAAVELSKQVEQFRSQGTKIRWVVAFSKPCRDILQVLLKPEDHVVTTEFDTVENMPWIMCTPLSEVAEEALQFTQNVSEMPKLSELPEFDGLTVVCGSLYLVGQYLRSNSRDV